MNKAQKTNMQRILVFLLLVAVAVLILLTSTLFEKESLEAKQLKASLSSIIVEQIGTPTNLHTERISAIAISQRSDMLNAELFIHADKRESMLETKETMWQQSITLLAKLSEIERLDTLSVTWIYPVVNKQEQPKDTKVMSFTIDQATRDQLIWENVEPTILPNLVYDYKEHPILSK